LERIELGPPSAGARILLVEDDAECRSALKDVLEEGRFAVTEAGDGQVALDEMTRGLHPALVILDLQMPVMSGLELLQIMDSYDRLSRLPVLVISGTPRAEFACGGAVIGFIPKPLDLAKLLETVTTYIGSREYGRRGGLATIPD
jgi:two-component system cell cycle response regulator DivK